MGRSPLPIADPKPQAQPASATPPISRPSCALVYQQPEDWLSWRPHEMGQMTNLNTFQAHMWHVIWGYLKSGPSLSMNAATSLSRGFGGI